MTATQRTGLRPVLLCAVLSSMAACAGSEPESDVDHLSMALTGNPLVVTAVKASADDGNVPANVLDGNLSTRWSCNGVGCWIRADLGASRSVTGVAVGWYLGDKRASSFTVSVSADGISYTQVLARKSSGTTLQLEPYEVATTAARYVKLTVNGNTSNAWASVTELKLYGGDIAPAPAPAPAPSPPPGSTVDAFGVTMLNSTKAGGETWSLPPDPRSDGRFDPQLTISQNADGSWKIKDTQVRMDVMTSAGYSLTSSSTQNRATLASRGYMQSPKDWKNVEITGFVKVNSGGSNSHITWYARGGRHSDSVPCEGSAYKGSLTYDGRVRFQKESWHVYYDQAPYASATSSYLGRWIGFKAIIRNASVNGVPAVHMEGWLNDSADKVTWKRITSYDDSGSWGGNSTHCGGTNDKMILSWGGPLACFRWDDSPDVDFKWLSVREIE
jgi:hypothetical protein